MNNRTPSTMARPGARSSRVVGLTAAALIALAGCSGGGDSSGQDPTVETPGAAAPTTSTPDPASSPPTAAVSPPTTAADPSTAAPTTPASTPANNGLKALLTAGKTALDKVNGTVSSIEEEDRGARWEVQVVTSDGTEWELETSSDGTKILRGPTKEHDDADDRAKHRRRASEAKIDHRKAAHIMVGAVPGGRITELDLDGHHGKTVWEADVVDSSHVKHEVMIDAGTGKVLRNQPDD